METFSDRLAIVIEESGLKRPEFAQKAGVGTSALAKWLSGRITPKSEQLWALSKVAGVTMEWLLTGEGTKRPSLAVYKDGFILMIVSLVEARLTKFFFLPPDDPNSISLAAQQSFCDAYLKADDETRREMLGLKDSTFQTISSRMLAAIGTSIALQLGKKLPDDEERA